MPLVIVFALLPLSGLAGETTGTLLIAVRDPSGFALKAQVRAVNQSKDFEATAETNDSGDAVLQSVPSGRCQIAVTSNGFAPFSQLYELKPASRTRLTIKLTVAAVSSTVEVSGSPTLLDPGGTSAQHMGRQTLEALPASTPNREVISAVESQPGWLVEANGVLHPRGSEYNTTYVIDGLPVTNNLSPVFSAGIALSDIDSVEVRTSGYPAEYGRRLGGIIEVTSARPHTEGFHGTIDLGGGSFDTTEGDTSLLYAGKSTSLAFAGSGYGTSRYLDPPDQANFTNHGSGFDVSGSLEHDFAQNQTIRLWLGTGDSSFQVPNELSQETAGQRQHRRVNQTSGHFDYDRQLTPKSLLSARLMVRESGASLSSNQFSTPIAAAQDRSLLETTGTVTLSAEQGNHVWKTGVQLAFPSLQEKFGFAITDPSQFDPAVPPIFNFRGMRRGHSPGLFAQDQYKWKNWTLSYGLRWDNYSLATSDSGFSPRLALAYYAAPLGVVIHASYDRVLQEPPLENLLLASSASVLRLDQQATLLPIPLSRGDFGEFGLSKLFLDHLRVDANAFLRNQRDFSDDDLLLNTGVNLPTSFARSSVYGAELKTEMPQWSRFSGFISYSYSIGRVTTPVTGGLFLADDAQRLLTPGLIFPVSQDQRHTLHTQLRYAATKKLWLANNFWYGSGLPTELDPGASLPQLIAQFGAGVVSQVDFGRRRVKPGHSVDLSLGYEFWRHEKQNAALQLDATNITDKLNVLDFAGLFSGTAIAKPRAFSLRAGYSF